jgi:hypothetical protein
MANPSAIRRRRASWFLLTALAAAAVFAPRLSLAQIPEQEIWWRPRPGPHIRKDGAAPIGAAIRAWFR